MNTTLNVKQFSIAWLAVFVIMTIFAFVPMKLEIAPWFLPLAAAPQGDAMSMRILIYLGRLIGAGLFTFIYTKTSEGKPPVGHGLRYGLGIGLLLYVPWMVSAFAISDWSASALVTRTVVGVVEAIVCGLALAYIYKPAKSAAA